MVSFGADREALTPPLFYELSMHDVEQTRLVRVKFEPEVGSVKLSRLSVRLIVHVLLVHTESRWRARSREILALLVASRC